MIELGVLVRARRVLLRGMLASGVAGALTVASTGVASAQTSFQASVAMTATLPAGPCSNGATFCGTANIAGFGAASWNLYLTGVTDVRTSCGSTYTATTDFTLDRDGSTLALNESGYICGPGLDASGYFKEGPTAYGHPNYPHGTWSVDTADSTGQFTGLGGSGTDDLFGAGAHIAGTYSGTLGS